MKQLHKEHTRTKTNIVSALFENLRDGASIEEFLTWFPGVRREQVETVLDFGLKALIMPIAR